ncbi:MAG: HD domain-containing protein, partial [Deltaproteobacteria bacterium]|nr:HD domain-containing protein [Deltaproteobacteria bacterium]
ELTIMIADKINRARDGHFKDISFNKNEMNELRIAAWLHDVGKVAIPEYVMDKSTKLTTVNDRIELLKTRFEIIKRDIEIDVLKKKLAQGTYADTDTPRVNQSRKIKNLEEDYAFLVSVNRAVEYMSDESVERIKKIAKKKWMIDGRKQALLSDDEIENLIIRKGTLTDNERTVMNNHAAITYRMLSQMPFPKKLKNVPDYASSHHEFLNGEGYPQGLKGDEISLQARILALADVFEALTASDRPYREGNTLSQALKILGFMVKDNQLDHDIYNLFVNEKIYIDYARRELFASQIDETEVREALK